jgi:DNA-binding CsgD family transcriptional regulator
VALKGNSISVMERFWPLTGRDEELAAMTAAALVTDGPLGIVLSGAAGVGKTRLAREVVAAAERRGIRTLWLPATACSQQLPLGAFAPALGDLEGDSFRVFQRAADALAGSGPESEVVVGIDDAHLLDDLSAALLLRLVLDSRFTVILTLRSREPVPDAVEAIWKDGHLDRLELQALSARETHQLLEAALSGTVDTSSAEALFALTEGNPLYLRHVVQGEVGSGRLARSRSCWSWDEKFEASPELIDLVDRSMSAAPAGALEVLDLLTVGGSLEVGLLTGIVAGSQLEAAEACSVVVVDQDGGGMRARVGHPLYGEVRRARIGQVKARRHRGAIAAAMAGRSHETGSDLLRRAALHLDSDLKADPGLFTAAADHAMQLFDFPLAQRLASAAVDAGGGLESRLALGYAQSFGNNAAAATQTLGEARAQGKTDLDVARASVSSAGHTFFMLGRAEEAGMMLCDCGDTVSTPESRALVVPMSAVFEACLGRPDRAVELADSALQVPGLPRQADFFSLWALVGGLGMLGRAEGVGEYADRAWTLGAGSYDCSFPRLTVAFVELVALRLAGYVHEAERKGRARLAEVDPLLLQPALMAQGLAAEAELARGMVRTSCERLQHTVDRLATEDTSGWAHLLGTGLTVSLSILGDGHAAAEAARRVEERRHPGHVWVEPDVLLSRAWVAAAQGALSEAIIIAHRAADWAAEHEHFAHEMFALATAVRFGDRSVADALAALATRVDGPRAPAAARQAAALAADDGAQLLKASREFAQMGDQLSAADAAAQAAIAFQRHGMHGSKLSAAARAARLQTLCEGARTPALKAVVRPLPLTDREREVVSLAAQGLSNRAIADRLVVSARTVEGHLYRASAKLGTSSRAEFAELLDVRP